MEEESMELQYFDKFEYMTKSFRNLTTSKLEAEMNILGKDGWEFVTIANNYGGLVYIFKRRLICTNV